MKWLRLYARLRYWRLRAISAERELQVVRTQGEAERWRNLSREDMFVSAAVMGGRGMIGISPRQGPAEPPQVNSLAIAPDPWQALKFQDRAEFETEWLPDAIAHGVSPQKAKNDFMAEIARRKKFNDEPSM